MKILSVLVLCGEENPALPVLKSLGQYGVKLTVASHIKYAPGLFSRYTARRLLSPDPWRSENQYIEWVVRTVSDDHYDMIIPLGEKASLWVAKNKKRVSKYTEVPFPAPEIYMTARDKGLTMKAASSLNIPIPKTYFPEEEPLSDICNRILYPTVLKPRISYGARGIYFPNNPEELYHYYSMATEKYGPCIIQEYIPQTGMQYKAEAVLDSKCKVIAVGVYDKPRYYPVSGGSSTLNRTVYRPDICEVAKDLLEGINWYGMGDCDFIEDPRDGSIKLMEINPRFTRSIRILVEAGLDFPALLLKAALNEKMDIINEYKIGLNMRYLLPDLMWFIKSADRYRYFPGFFNFFDRSTIFEMLSFHDIKPSLFYLLSQLLKLVDSGSRNRLLSRS